MDKIENFMDKKLFDECDDHSNKNFVMITTIYFNHKTDLEDYVTNIALISFYCKKGMFQMFVSKPSETLFFFQFHHFFLNSE